MHLEELIDELQKAQRFIPDDSTVYLHYDWEEIEVYGISVRSLGEGEYEVMIE